MYEIIICLAIGLVAGLLSGIFGIGGGIVIIPALVFILGFSQHLAQGTTLALMVPPIGIFAAINYYKKGYVNLKLAAIICVGFIIGSIITSNFVVNLPDDVLKKVFGALLFFIAIRMIFFK